MNPGDEEAEKKFKEASEAYAVLSDAGQDDVSMISSATLHLMAVQAAEQVDSADLTLTAQILAIFSAIFSEICSAAADRGGAKQWPDERCEYP